MSKKREVIIGTAFAFGAALAYGGSAVLIKEGMAGLAPPLVGATISLLSGTLGLSVIGLRNLGSNLRREKKSVGLLLISGIFAGLGIMAHFFALSMAPVILVSPLTAISPLFVLLWSYFFLGRLEKITPRVVLGTVFVVVGVALVTIGRVA